MVFSVCSFAVFNPVAVRTSAVFPSIYFAVTSCLIDTSFTSLSSYNTPVFKPVAVRTSAVLEAIDARESIPLDDVFISTKKSP